MSNFKLDKRTLLLRISPGLYCEKNAQAEKVYFTLRNNFWRYFKCQNENAQSKKYKSVHCLDQQLSPLHNPQLFLQFVFIHIVLLPELHSSNKAQDGHLTSVSLQSAQQGMMYIERL